MEKAGVLVDDIYDQEAQEIDELSFFYEMTHFEVTIVSIKTTNSRFCSIYKAIDPGINRSRA